KFHHMLTSYLTWYLNLDLELAGTTDRYLLLSSSVSKPTELLHRHLRQFAEDGVERFSHLSSAWGHPVLVENLTRRYGVEPERLVTTNGASNGIYLLCRALLNSGSHVIIESPVYEPLPASPEFIGVKIDRVQRRPPDYQLDPEETAELVRPSTALILITNLHNPTGALLADDLLLELAGRARARNPRILIVVDEVYHDFVHKKQQPAARLEDCFISLHSLTKVYGLKHLHCGWIIGPTSVINRIRQLQLLVEGSYARVLEDISACVTEHLEEYWDRADLLVRQNRAIVTQYLHPLTEDGVLEGEIPEYGCIAFPRLAEVKNADEILDQLARQFQVYVVPGRFFGNPQGMRIGFGAETGRLKQSLERLVDGLRSLRR
ncbi:MAG: pyridoxal phosphate-dependent aminotransferase, partial [Candidatus Zixiibacteriota bacterium]